MVITEVSCAKLLVVDVALAALPKFFDVMCMLEQTPNNQSLLYLLSLFSLSAPEFISKYPTP